MTSYLILAILTFLFSMGYLYVTKDPKSRKLSLTKKLIYSIILAAILPLLIIKLQGLLGLNFLKGGK